MNFRNFIPLIFFLGIALLLANVSNLANNPRLMPNMIGKKIQDFETTDLFTGEKFTSSELTEEVTILNLWASWCTACKAEHSIHEAMSEKGYRIYSINVADKPEPAKAYLEKLGNPFRKTGVDPDRAITIAMGATGTPETYVINTDGIIYFHQRGYLDRETMEKKLIPIIDELKKKQ